MSQADVLNFLESQRKNNDNWFRIKDIQEALNNNGCGTGTLKGVGNDCYILSCSNFIEVRGVGVWNHYKEFRAFK